MKSPTTAPASNRISIKNIACNRSTPPYGNWASHGIYASNSSNVTLTDLDIHGMANRGILNGKLSNWSLTRVHIVANGWAGWDGDLGCGTAGCSSDSGNMTFQSVEIAWNGCTEQYPTHNIYACWAQSNQGYGDGFGTAQTGGNWTFTDSYFHHNTSDGLDLLYADGTGSVTVERSRSEGNAGNQMKITGNSLIENSVIVGNCSYFQGVNYIVGNNSNSGNTSGDNCRAYGNALVVSLGSAPHNVGLHSTIRYNSITSEGNCLILAINGATSSNVQIQNNLLVGAPFWITERRHAVVPVLLGHQFLVEPERRVAGHLHQELGVESEVDDVSGRQQLHDRSAGGRFDA